jgi:acetyltransferase-like isoleucine patch superfamily enzyme
MSQNDRPAPAGNQVEKQTVRQVLADRQASAAEKYRAMVLGADAGWFRLLLFEFGTLLFGATPGALGLYLRRKVFKHFFRSCGANVVIGRHCTFRHPGRIALGNDVVIDEFCCLDARGTGEGGLVLEDRVVINRLSAIRSKGGDIHIGESVNIGSASQLISQSGIVVGKGAAIAGDCYLSAGTYDLEEISRPPDRRVSRSEGPIRIGENAWLATRVTILDGVEIGDGAIISAGSVVSHKVAPRCVAHGNPAEVIFRMR